MILLECKADADQRDTDLCIVLPEQGYLFSKQFMGLLVPSLRLFPFSSELHSSTCGEPSRCLEIELHVTEMGGILPLSLIWCQYYLQWL